MRSNVWLPVGVDEIQILQTVPGFRQIYIFLMLQWLAKMADDCEKPSTIEFYDQDFGYFYNEYLIFDSNSW